jgi:NADPH-dependent curcumin reductase CurA
LRTSRQNWPQANRTFERPEESAGGVQAGKIKNKVDVQHGLENGPATLRRLFEGRNEGKQLLRVAGAGVDDVLVRGR